MRSKTLLFCRHLIHYWHLSNQFAFHRTVFYMLSKVPFPFWKKRHFICIKIFWEKENVENMFDTRIKQFQYKYKKHSIFVPKIFVPEVESWMENSRAHKLRNMSNRENGNIERNCFADRRTHSPNFSWKRMLLHYITYHRSSLSHIKIFFSIDFFLLSLLLTSVRIRLRRMI